MVYLLGEGGKMSGLPTVQVLTSNSSFTSRPVLIQTLASSRPSEPVIDQVGKH